MFGWGVCVHGGVNVPIGYEDVLPSVLIKIQKGQTPLHVLAMDSQSRIERDIVEGSVTIVVIEDWRVIGEIALENIEPAIAIIVGGVSTHARLRYPVLIVCGSGGHADFLKRTVPLVVIEETGSRVACDVNIGPPVVIEIPSQDRKPFVILCPLEAGALGDVGKMAAPIVVVQ